MTLSHYPANRWKSATRSASASTNGSGCHRQVFRWWFTPGHVRVERSGSRFRRTARAPGTPESFCRLPARPRTRRVRSRPRPKGSRSGLRRYKRRLKSHDNGPDPMAGLEAGLESLDYRVMNSGFRRGRGRSGRITRPAVVAETTLSLRTMWWPHAVIGTDMRVEPRIGVPQCRQFQCQHRVSSFRREYRLDRPVVDRRRAPGILTFRRWGPWGALAGKQRFERVFGYGFE